MQVDSGNTAPDLMHRSLAECHGPGSAHTRNTFCIYIYSLAADERCPYTGAKPSHIDFIFIGNRDTVEG